MTGQKITLDSKTKKNSQLRTRSPLSTSTSAPPLSRLSARCVWSSHHRQCSRSHEHVGLGSHGYLPWRLLWHPHGRTRHGISLQRDRRANVCRLNAELFGLCHFIWKTSWSTTHRGGVDNLQHCIAIGRVSFEFQVSMSFRHDQSICPCGSRIEL